MLESTIGRLAGGENLSQEETRSAIAAILAGQVRDAEIALLLTGLSLKGETVEEVAGAAAALRQSMTPIRTRRTGLVDTCGTGGDGARTFNISTAAALVTAAAGVPVAKHGNRRVTSRTGSADVLAELGVNVEADVPHVQACLDQLGIGFCFAPLLHPAMRQVAEVRRQLGVPTIFNLLGPLTNPAGAPFQVLGVGHPQRRRLLAEALALLGTQRAVVVCGRDGLDEITLATTTDVTEIAHAAPPRDLAWQPADFGLQTAPLDSLVVDTAADSAALIRHILAGQPGPPREITLLNAAAAIWVTAAETSLPAAAHRAADAIDSGAAQRLLGQLVECSRN